MNDAKLVEAVREAVSTLNKLAAAAAESGIAVEMETRDTGEAEGPVRRVQFVATLKRVNILL